jgi:hypothetical protein
MDVSADIAATYDDNPFQPVPIEFAMVSVIDYDTRGDFVGVPFSAMFDVQSGAITKDAFIQSLTYSAPRGDEPPPW